MTASLLIPARGARKRPVIQQSYESALVAVGRISAIRNTSNPDRIVVHSYHQPAPLHSQAGGGSWAGITHCFPVCAIPDPLSGAIDACRNTTLRALIELCQQSARRITKCFHSLLSAGRHDQQCEPGANAPCAEKLSTRSVK